MKLFYDFHIHTALSPCSDDDMTPNSIINMSIIKGLDAIAITDHNSFKNCKVCYELGKENGIIVIPGVEIQTIEDIHVVVLFKNIEDIESFFEDIEDKRLVIKNRPDRFGNQIIYDINDVRVGIEENYLITPFNITIEKLIELTKIYDGVVFPAHINRNSFSILNSLGFISKDLDIKNIEWYKVIPNKEEYKNRVLKEYRELINSDAHNLISISEKENYINVKEKTINSIFDTLNSTRGESV